MNPFATRKNGQFDGPVNFRLQEPHDARFQQLMDQDGQSAGLLAKEIVVDFLDRQDEPSVADQLNALEAQIVRLRKDIAGTLVSAFVTFGGMDEDAEAVRTAEELVRKQMLDGD